MKPGRFLVIAAVCVGASSCSKSFVQDEWQCPLNQGENCQSIRQADQVSTIESPAPVAFDPPLVLGAKESESLSRDPGDVVRTSEEVARIWVAPFVDQDNVLHGSSYIYVVVRPARWVITEKSGAPRP